MYDMYKTKQNHNPYTNNLNIIVGNTKQQS